MIKNRIKGNDTGIDDELLQRYIDHFEADKKDLWGWEQKRKELHDAMFESIGIERTSYEGQELSNKIDTFCIPYIEKTDYMVAGLKKINTAKDIGEIQEFSLQLQNKMMFERLQREKAQRMEALDRFADGCRVCGGKSSARYNDHLAGVLTKKAVNSHICNDCAKNNPDAHHKKFRKMFIDK